MEVDIKIILEKYWGYTEFRSLQEDIIRSVTGKRDTLALMPTGGGKSITYQLSALTMEGICLVVTPLIALMKDQVEDLRQRGIAAEAIYTGMEAKQIESKINKGVGQKIKFLYVSPERLASDYFRQKLKQMDVAMIAVDEAHCISQWGYDFRPSYLRIAEVRAYFPDAPILALTATATPAVVEDIQAQLKFQNPKVLSKSFRRENISYVIRKTNDKLGELLHILSKWKGCAIVYVRKRSSTEELANFLNSNGYEADYYHAGLSSYQREQKQLNWKNNPNSIIVATNAFGMGIDKADVRLVVHYDIPDSLEAYFQEAGRAGRDEKRSFAVLLYNEATFTALKNRVDKNFPQKKQIREVYNSLGNYFQIEEGNGKGKVFMFDIENFANHFKFKQSEINAAINILQSTGYVECITDVQSRSRIWFRVLRDMLYRIELNDSFLDSMIEVILRNYSGVFAQFTYIDEQFIADSLNVDRQEVYQGLLLLGRRRIINFIPGNDKPYIMYHQPRVPASYLHISSEAYEDKRYSYSFKINQIVDYIESCGRCRQLFIMEYFGQKEKEPCGICDICLERKKKNKRGNIREIRNNILKQLENTDMEIKVLANMFDENKEQAIEQIRLLLDEQKIYYKTATLLSLKS